MALSIHHWRRLPLLIAAIAGWGGLALILLTCDQLGPGTPYPGTAALLPVLGTALVIGGGCVTGAMGPGRAAVPPGHAGDRPGVVLVVPLALAGAAAHAAVTGWPAGLPAKLAATVVSAGLAVITLHLVENPGRFAAACADRRGPAGRRRRRHRATATACVVLLALIPVPVGRGAAAPKANIATVSCGGGPRH